MFAMEAKASGAATDRSGAHKTGSIPTSIKRVKPAYVQSLRPESSNVLDDDIRLSYAKLLFNAFNGLEKTDLSQKFRALCVDNPCMSVKWIGDKGKLNRFLVISCIMSSSCFLSSSFPRFF